MIREDSQSMTKIGIIGNGVAATTALREMRKKDSSAEIHVFTDERHAYYPRPHLIDYVSGIRTEEEVIQYGLDWYEKMDAALHLSSPVTKIITDSQTVIADSKKVSNFDSLLIATGCKPFIPPFEGLEKKNVHVIRTLDDAIDIKESVKGAGREIIVGGGILGIELAAAIKKIGGAPIIVTNIDVLLPVQLDGGASEILHRRLDELGISVLLGFTCRKFDGNDAVTGVFSSAGDKISGDLAVIATGVRSNVQLANDSGIETVRGITVDEYMQTSAENIYAAGDCAEWNGQWYGIIPWALATAKVAAANMLEPGSERFKGIIPSNTLQVAGIDLTSVGFIHPETPEYESIISVDRKNGTYYKAVLKDNKLVGGIALGNRKVAMKLRRLISKGEDVSETKKTLFET
jgi:nitrite reductase (NADH) large subunit